MNSKIKIAIAVFIYLSFTLKFQLIIYNNKVLDKRQKVLNSIMIWIIPFMWFFIIRKLITMDYRIMTKKQRDKLQRKESIIDGASTYG